MQKRNDHKKMYMLEEMMATNLKNDEIAEYAQSDISKMKKYFKWLHGECPESKQNLMEITYFTKKNVVCQKPSNIPLDELLMDCILFGTLMLVQKKLVLSLEMDWEEWVASNYDIDMETIKNYMEVAKVPSIEKYYILGLERLVDLAKLANSIYEDDYSGVNHPIAELFSNAGIVLLTREHMEEDKFYEAVDQLILSYKISEAVKEEDNITMIIDQSLLLKALKHSKKAIGRQEIKQMIAIKQSGGDPNEYIRDTFCHQGSDLAA